MWTWLVFGAMPLEASFGRMPRRVVPTSPSPPLPPLPSPPLPSPPPPLMSRGSPLPVFLEAAGQRPRSVRCRAPAVGFAWTQRRNSVAQRIPGLFSTVFGFWVPLETQPTQKRAPIHFFFPIEVHSTSEGKHGSFSFGLASGASAPF